jgi:hypothetical protein
LQNFSRQIHVLGLPIAFRDFGILAVLYENQKNCLTFLIFDKLFSILLWISWIGYLKVLHVEFSSNLSLVWLKIKFFKILTAILYGKITRSRI